MKSTIICEKCGKIYDGGVCPKCGTYNENNNGEETSLITLKRIKENGLINSLKDEKDRKIDERQRKKEEERKVRYEKEQKYQNKKDKRDKIHEDYGFTNDEIFKMYHNEAREADKVYKAFVTDGISRLEKVNGRFLASQLIKLDVLSQQNNRIIQQNNEIIELLKEIAGNKR